MYGSLVADPICLSEGEQKRYRAVYCGLCRELENRYGQISRMLLNYDCTFLLLFLQGMYEPPEESRCENCVAHPFEKREWTKSEFNEYAADMTVLLAYYKCLDDWHDDRRLDKGTAAIILNKRIIQLKQKWPRQFSAIENGINQLSRFEKSGVQDPDTAAALFGEILAEIFVFRIDRWEDTLRKFGHAIGCFIYLNDAAIDLDSDVRKKNYNPFGAIVDKEVSRSVYLRSVLKLYLSDAIHCLEYLPIVQDSEIIVNILCSGVWKEFNKKYDPGKESNNV